MMAHYPRTIEEAILWHDGEAAKSNRLFYRVCLFQERNPTLMKFLDSLGPVRLFRLIFEKKTIGYKPVS